MAHTTRSEPMRATNWASSAPYTARPVQAALSSACSFALGALLPLLLTVLSPAAARMWMIPGGSIVSLALLGMLSAHARRRAPAPGDQRGLPLGEPWPWR